MQSMSKTIEWAETHSFGLLETVRFATGVLLFLKGAQFMANPNAMFEAINMQHFSFVGMALAHFIIPAHLVGGAMIAAGLLTRLAAAANLPILLAAVLFVDYSQPSVLTQFSSPAYALLMLFLLATLVVLGSGRRSADRAIDREYALEEQHVQEEIRAAEARREQAGAEIRS